MREDTEKKEKTAAEAWGETWRQSPLELGDLRLPNRLVLAPMAGASSLCYRQICRDEGAAMTVTELCSAKGILYDQALKRNARYLAIKEAGGAQAIQLFGAEPALMAKAAERLFAHPLYGQMDLLDVNMGCPVDKVVKTGAGAALMKDLPRAEAMVRALVERARAYGKRVSVKCRLGWDASQINVQELALRVEEAGAALLAIHGRTRQAMYGGQASWEEIKACKKRLSIPVIGNGDIKDAKSATALAAYAQVDALMIGRAAVGNPFLFARLLGKQEPLRAEDFEATVRRHLTGLCESLGETVGVREFRGPLAAYVRGFPQAASLRRRLFTLEKKAEVLALLEEAVREGFPLHKNCSDVL